MLKKSILLSTGKKNPPKPLQNECADPKLPQYEPEGGKPTLAHLPGICSQNPQFYQWNQKSPKTASKRARRAKTRLIRTRRGETDPCASSWHMLKKSILRQIQSLEFSSNFGFFVKTLDFRQIPDFSSFEKHKQLFFLIRKAKTAIFSYSKGKKAAFPDSKSKQAFLRQISGFSSNVWFFVKPQRNRTKTL